MKTAGSLESFNPGVPSTMVGSFGLGRRKLGRDRRDPGEKVTLAILQHAADVPTVRIVVGGAGRIADAERIAADPGADAGCRHRPFGASDRQPDKSDRLREVLYQASELVDGELGEREVERGRRPDHYAVFRVPAPLGERIELGQGDAVELGRLDAEAAQARPEQRHYLARPLVRAGKRDDLANARALSAGAIEPLADEYHGALRRLDVEHRVGGETTLSKKRGCSL